MQEEEEKGDVISIAMFECTREFKRPAHDFPPTELQDSTTTYATTAQPHPSVLTLLHPTDIILVSLFSHVSLQPEVSLIISPLAVTPFAGYLRLPSVFIIEHRVPSKLGACVSPSLAPKLTGDLVKLHLHST